MPHPALLVLTLALLAGAAMTDWGRLARAVRALWVAAPQRLRIKGEWAMELRGPDGELKARRTGQQNIIVNGGLDHVKSRLFNSATALVTLHWIGIGTGAVPEVATDAALGAEVARAAGAYTAGGVGVATVEFTFPAAGGYEPAAISEAGLFNQLAFPGGTMFNRKTFPAFTKQNADTLKVTCTMTLTSA